MPYKKTTLVLATLTAMSLSLSAATSNKTIVVTTFADEDGENADACSLREAVVTASTGQAYGGCNLGEVWPTRMNTIQLDAGEYQLKRELQPTKGITINGKDPVDYSKVNILTNDYPAITAVKTRIRAVGNNRIINSSSLNQPKVVLNNIDLWNGYSSANGGAILAGGELELNNSSIYNSTAKAGGAIYLEGGSASLLANRGILQGNQAEQGSVLAMSCFDGLTNVSHQAYIDFMSIMSNGSANSQSTLAYCGLVDARIQASSIGMNQADPARGSIIQFSSKTPFADIRLDENKSKLMLKSNTVVQNSAYSTFLYNAAGIKNIDSNILAFNAPQGKSCRYAENREGVKDAKLFMRGNAVRLDTTADDCEYIADKPDDLLKNNAQLTGYTFDQVLYPLSNKTADAYTAFMPMYFANNSKLNNPLVNSTFDAQCSDFDQRGIQRISTSNPAGNGEKPHRCDIGATQVLRLTAGNIMTTNPSIVDLLVDFQSKIDSAEAAIKDPATDAKYMPYLHIQLDKYRNLKTYTEKSKKYRTAFIDPFVSNTPAEMVNSDGVREIKHLNADLYNVTVKSLGLGLLKDNIFKGQYDDNLKCEWDKDLKQIVMYRLDDRITSQDEYEFCQYQLTLKDSNPVQSSSGYIMAKFNNIAPYAKPLSYHITQGDSDWVELKLLDNINDDGDGDVKQLTNKANKLSYYTDAKGQDLAISFMKTLDPVQVSAERSGPCPDDNKLICYGGKIQVKLKNTLDPFNYKLQYVVYDADGLKSKPAIIELKNSGSESRKSGGGGSMGILSGLGLLGLVFYRRRLNRTS